MSEKEVQKEEIKKEEVEEKKFEGGARRGGGYQNKRGGGKVQYYEKGTRPENYEEKQKERKYQSGKKNQKPKMIAKPKAPFIDYEKKHITLETKVPEKPKKEELIKPMDEHEYENKYKGLCQQIDQLWQNYHKLNSTVHDPSIKKDDQQTLIDALLEARKAKAEAKNKAYNAWKEVHDKYSELKKSIEKSFNDSQKFRQKMKILMTKEELEQKIQDLKDILYNETNSVQEEKRLIKEIEDLENSLPYASPLDNMNKKFDEIKAERKKLGSQQHALWEVFEKARDDWSLINEQVQEKISQRNNNKQEKVKVNDEMQEKRQEVQVEEEKIIQKIKELNQDFRKSWHSYYEQQQSIKDIDFIVKIQTRLRRNEERKKREEKELKDKEEEDKLVQENPYKEELELCTLLISYCQQLLPSQKTDEQEKIQEEKKDIEQILNKGEWKKENLTVVKCKKDIENDFFAGKKKKQKKAPAQKQQTQQQKPEQQAINHKLDVIGYFDRLKVLAPLWANQLENTIKQLEEKKEYFIKYQDGSMPEEKKEEQEEKKEQEPKENDKEAEEQKEEKKEKPKKKQEKKKPELCEFNEQDFPSM